MTFIWVLALLLTLVISGSSGPSRMSAEASLSERTQSGSAPPGPPDRVALIREEHLLNIQLTTHEGRVVRFYDDLVKGKIVAINFMFSACRQGCSVATEHLLEAQQALAERMRREVTFLSISLEPEQDTPDVLRGYAQAHGTGPGWYFLTG